MNKKTICMAIIITILSSSFVSAANIESEERDKNTKLITDSEEWVKIISPQNSFNLTAPLIFTVEVSNNFEFYCVIFEITYDNEICGRCRYTGEIWAGEDYIIPGSEDEDSFMMEVKWMKYLKPQEIEIVCNAVEKIPGGSRSVARSEKVTGFVKETDENPCKPTISGPTTAKWSRIKNIRGEYQTEELTFTASVNYESSESLVKYKFYWYDLTYDETDWVPANEEVTIKKRYSNEQKVNKEYPVRVVVFGDNGMQSRFSESVLLIVKKPSSLTKTVDMGLLQRIIDNFPILQNLLKS